MEKKSNMLLKVSGILMIIFGGIGIILGIIAVLGVSVVAALLGSEANMGLLVAGSFLFLVSSAISLVAGILGVINAAAPEKAKTCIVFGIMTMVFSVLGSVLNIIGGNSFDFMSFLIGLVLPVLYLIGAFQNKSRA